MELRNEIAKLIGVDIHNTMSNVEYIVLESKEDDGYTRQLIEYESYGDKVRAFLLLPKIQGNNPAILINHQHNREHHLGKSEVCGLAGNPLQAFGPELVKRGFVVLAPDSICFEDRRKDPTVEGFDFWQHFHEMCYRILQGEYLMKKVLDDAMAGIPLLSNLDCVDNTRIGTLGHSYGGNTALFLTALDERVSFACASGSACTYKNRMLNGVGIEMASVIPGFIQKYDIDDLVSCIAPRNLLIISAADDKYSKDAPYIVEKVSPIYAKLNASTNLRHKRYLGGHALTDERFHDIIEWINERGTNYAERRRRSMAEYWDVYDVNRELTGKTIKRGEPLGENEFYVCCEVWIVNSKNQMLVTQRHPDKKAGGQWEFTGGGVLAGETTLLAAVREVKEELGVCLKETELELYEVYKYKNYFMDIYVVRKDLNEEEIVPDKNEVIDWKWLSQKEIEQFIADRKMVRSVGIRYEMFGKF